MYDFILQLMLVASMAVVAYMFIRALPRVTPVEDPPTIYDYVNDWLQKVPVHHLDDRLNSILFKLLKRMHVITMKFDNRIARELNRVRREGERKEHPVRELFDEVNSNKDEI